MNDNQQPIKETKNLRPKKQKASKKPLVISLIGGVVIATAAGIIFPILSAPKDRTEDGTEDTSVHAHTFEHVSYQEPSCDFIGYEYLQCTGCEEKAVRTILPTGEHNFVKVDGYPATCDNSGLTDGEA
jgi:hypothetical protein